ncbi:MAG: anhydro-N-acetylmuramic acid kinase [Bacteroidetes bacterium]|nr:anhydro-N-acetylmuramic acid kinase [Bacteroidota bacterium]MBS1648769.1 anhydro-N-acetylmuramic acid kinase [Bacteroidota bacterium]
MNKNIQQLYNIGLKEERTIIGLMSGTSLDGLDIALCKFRNSGSSTKIILTHFETVPYNNQFKQSVKSIFSKRQVDLEKVCLLNEWIAEQHATIIHNFLSKNNIATNAIDLIASHGQSIYHAPKFLHQHNMYGNGTLQIGDGDHLAVKTGIITISDFRQKHIAAGGEGAPLAMYGDYLLFSKPGENRIMLNIGGIANFTFLSEDLDADKIMSTDTGPGNTLMDAYVQQNFEGKFFDENSLIAQQGSINEPFLNALIANDFFEKPLPKTTGPELFNLEYVAAAKASAGITAISHADVMATLNIFTAITITNAIKKIINNKHFVLYTSGGGKHNTLLMQHIKQQLNNCIIKDMNEFGINPDAKEAILFATLANEAVCGGTTNYGKNIPSVSMGKISFPF